MAPAAQKTLVGDLPLASSPQISGHPHYESPFQTVDMRRQPGTLRSISQPLSPCQLTSFRQSLSHHPSSVSTAFLIGACVLVLFLGLGLVLCGARLRMDLRGRLRKDQCAGDDAGSTADEKGRRRVWIVGSDGVSLAREDRLEGGEACAGSKSAKNELFEHLPGRLRI
ncbi:hypothetical protein VM1G_06174 [Cytospora mali]|uniref:Uncharacterized protein n=1 Tax=Cytospora mali TaxID=578113 RepID=A0A194W132_CYTMA|nr:hypothetical protein VM1G_06174 [Valsa mali]